MVDVPALPLNKLRNAAHRSAQRIAPLASGVTGASARNPAAKALLLAAVRSSPALTVASAAPRQSNRRSATPSTAQLIASVASGAPGNLVPGPAAVVLNAAIAT